MKQAEMHVIWCNQRLLTAASRTFPDTRLHKVIIRDSLCFSQWIGKCTESQPVRQVGDRRSYHGKSKIEEV